MSKWKFPFIQTEQPYDLIFDLAGTRSLSACRRILTPNGALVLGGSVNTRALDVLVGMIELVVVSRFTSQKLVTFMTRRSQDDLVFLKDLIEAGKLRPVIDRTYPLSESAAAIRYLMEGHAAERSLSRSHSDLLSYLFGGQAHRLARPMAAWLASSRRFTVFVTAFRDKIRRKLRATQDREGLLDLRLELETAYVLLREASLNLVYEPEQAEGGRRPDFAVTFTTSLTFMVEATRLRAGQKNLADTICSKLGQLVPQRSNVLVVGVEALQLTPEDLRSMMLRLQQRAEGEGATFLQQRGFRDRSEFFRQYQRLSEVLVRGTVLRTGEPVVDWVNPQAKYPLPNRVRTALLRSHTV